MLSLSLLALTALGGTPISLPPGETSDAWESEMYDKYTVTAEVPVECPWVIVEVSAQRWIATVCDHRGEQSKEVFVIGNREEVLAYAEGRLGTVPIVALTILQDRRQPDMEEDSDRDGLSDLEEGSLGTDPREKDSDGDGLLDWDEVQITSDPLRRDTDEDGLLDGDEVHEHGSNPLLPDSDSDGLGDLREVELGTSPTHRDTDGDGLHDLEELEELGTSPILPDSDGDGLRDDKELKRGLKPLIPDTDGDALYDGAEVLRGTDPHSLDSDGDGLWDGFEVNHGINPMSGDQDRDGLNDGDEARMDLRETDWPSDPRLADTDGDDLSDGVERRVGSVTDVKNPDTDGDGLNDGYEVNRQLRPDHEDTDGDGLSDYVEVEKYPGIFDPLNWDSDGDLISDSREAASLYGHRLPGTRDDPGTLWFGVGGALARPAASMNGELLFSWGVSRSWTLGALAGVGVARMSLPETGSRVSQLDTRAAAWGGWSKDKTTVGVYAGASWRLLSGEVVDAAGDELRTVYASPLVGVDGTFMPVAGGSWRFGFRVYGEVTPAMPRIRIGALTQPTSVAVVGLQLCLSVRPDGDTKVSR